MSNEREIVESLLKRTDLTDWDKDFMISISERLNSGKQLTEKQTMWVHRIADRYSDNAVKERTEWKERWISDKSLRDKAEICAKYYLHSGYYTWSKDILLDDKFIPSLKQFKVLTENKYAMKVLNGHNAEAKYPVGSMVHIRKTLSGPDAPRLRRARRELKTDLAMVISTTEEIVSAANGNKRYKIVIVGESTPILAEERNLKKLSKKLS